MMTLVLGYVSLKNFGIVLSTVSLVGYIGRAFSLECKKSIQEINIVDTCDEEMPTLCAISTSNKPHRRRAKTKTTPVLMIKNV